MHVRVLPDTDGFRDRLKRYLEMLEKYTKLSVKLDLDTGGVSARLRELTHDRQVRVNVVADTGEAAARIAALTRERRARISADADTAPAEARMRAFTGRRWRLGVNVHLARGGFDRIKSGLRDIGSGAAEVARNFGRLFTLSIEQTVSALQGIGSGISSAAQGALGMAAGFAQSLAAALPLLVAVTAIASWVTVVASGLIAVLALAALPVLPIGLAAIAAAGDMKTLGDNAEEAMQKASALMRAEFGGALRDITGWFKQAEPVLKSFFDSGAQFVRPMVKSILDFTDVLFPKLTEAMNSAGMKAFTDALPAALVGIGASLGDFFLVLANGGDRLKSLLPPLNGLLDVFLQGIASLAVQFSPEIAASISWFAGSLQQFFQVFKDNAQATAAMMRLVDLGLRALVVGFDIAMTAWNALAIAAVAAWHAVQTAWDGLTAATSAVWSAVTSWTASAWASVTSTVSSAASAVGSAVSSAWNSVTSWTASAWASVTSTVLSRVSAVGSAVSSGWNNVQSWTSSAWNACVNAVTSAWSNIASGVSNGIGTVVSYVSSLPGKILSAIGDLGSLLFDKGKSAIQGLVNGMKSISISGVVSGIVSSLNPFKASLPAAPAAAPRSLMASPVMALAAMPAAAYASPLEQALRPVASGIRSLDSYGYGQRAAAGLRRPDTEPRGAGRARYGAQITVNARTNADPHEIGKAIAWELKTSGR
ncbi:hypothetical protein [Kitasatospora sp. NPDC058046]|uniref:phage tail protein n=1 Tax=Kitasatospora sp. NPDC058046 TaxID=3346312 RepID=UPI0036D8ED10